MIGVDIGTTTTKSVLFTADGKVKESHHVGYPLHTPDALTAEQKPDEIFAAVLSTIKKVVAKGKVNKEDLKVVSFSSAMHSLIAVDESGEPLTNCITWADKRAATYADKLCNQRMELYKRTGMPLHPMSPLVKIKWLKHEHPEIFEKTAKFISIKEYIFHKLFDEYIVDYSIASATGMLNLETKQWDEVALTNAEISSVQLSTIVPATHVSKGIKSEIAHTLKINEDTPFVIGASDGVLSNLGLDAIDQGEIAITIGTSGAIRTVTKKPVLDKEGRTFCYAFTDDLWVVGGPINNGGMILRWAKDELAKSESAVAERLDVNVYDLLTKMADTIRPGAEGLIFHPYLSGERAPLWDADARGSFSGLSLHHGKEHMIRAVLEGIMYNLYTVLEPLEELLGPAREIKASGGFARSEVWKQMMADIFNAEVRIPESFESSCLGAAVLGLYAIGEVESVNVVEKMVGKTTHLEPIAENVKVYKKILPVYRDIMDSMKPHYAKLAELQHEEEANPYSKNKNDA
ncbi:MULTISPECIES: gluconokinase [Bacillaceae]|uniref:gluconokinase n=1 Tax=Bacillaceae TaxID=186817 RepID=UPI0010440F9C|nr:gluconokinase [Bacillus sp. CBEL-1]TDB51210.1 gluconokinase [Bacillus sp. CBEL-1]